MEQVYSARAQSLRLQPLYCQRRPALERIFSHLGLHPNPASGVASRNPKQAGAEVVAEYGTVRPSGSSRVRQHSVSSGSVSGDTVASDRAPDTDTGPSPAADNAAECVDNDSMLRPLCRGLSVTPPASSAPSPAALSEWSEEDVFGTGNEDGGVRFVSTKRASRPRRRRSSKGKSKGKDKDKTKEAEVLAPAFRITRLVPAGELEATRDLSFTDNSPVGLVQQLPALLMRRTL